MVPNTPTTSEVQSARRKAVGGKRDRCTKGKSCSAACIEWQDRCLVEFPTPVSKATGKLRDKVQQPELFPTEKFIDKATIDEIRNFKREVERGIIKAVKLDHEEKYNLHRQAIIDFNRSLSSESVAKIRVPVTWDRLMDVKESYSKAKDKIMARMEKAAENGDRKKYQTEELRLFKIQRQLGTKVGDTARLSKGDTWYRMGGGLKEIQSKRKPEKRPETLYEKAKDKHKDLMKRLRYSVATDSRGLYEAISKNIEVLRNGVKNEGIPYRVGPIPSWDRLKREIKEYDAQFSKILNQVEKDAAKGKIKSANLGVEKLYKLYSRKGEKFGVDFPLERVEFIRKGKSLTPMPLSGIHYPLRTGGEFGRTSNFTFHPSLDLARRFAKILDAKDYYGASEREKIMSRLKIGESTFIKSINLIKRYTGNYYEIVKEARDALISGNPLTSVMKRALAHEKAINRFIDAFPKEEIPKFRGGRITTSVLNDLIESSKTRGEFNSNGLTSWSSDLSVAKRFADRPPGLASSADKPVRVIMQTVNKRGIPIESITEVEREMEILTSGRARYRHTGVYNVVEYQGETYHIFNVNEY